MNYFTFLSYSKHTFVAMHIFILHIITSNIHYILLYRLWYALFCLFPLAASHILTTIVIPFSNIIFFLFHISSMFFFSCSINCMCFVYCSVCRFLFSIWNRIQLRLWYMVFGSYPFQYDVENIFFHSFVRFFFCCCIFWL